MRVRMYVCVRVCVLCLYVFFVFKQSTFYILPTIAEMAPNIFSGGGVFFIDEHYTIVSRVYRTLHIIRTDNLGWNAKADDFIKG